MTVRSRRVPHRLSKCSLRTLLTVLAASCALVCSGCALYLNAAGPPFKPVEPNVLTVATAFLPASGFWQGSPPTGGFEAGLATALAHKLGLHRLAVVQVPFASLVSGHLHGADIALSQLTPTAQRER